MQQDSGTDGRIHWHIATGGEMHAALFTAVRNTPALHLLLSSNELQCALISPCLVLSVHQPNSLDVTLTRLVCVCVCVCVCRFLLLEYCTLLLFGLSMLSSSKP
jgi:hypothetical protein